MQCKAKSKRSGERCKKYALKGKAVCMFHGGKSTGPPKGSRNASTHGIYEAGLSQAEIDAFPEIELSKLDDELKICRLRLARALKAEKESIARDEMERLDLVKITETGGFVRKTSRRPDYYGIIDRLLGRIGKLELQRAALRGANTGDGKGRVEEMIRKIENGLDMLRDDTGE